VGKDQGTKGCFNQFPQGTHNVAGRPKKDCGSPESALGQVASTKEALDYRSNLTGAQLGGANLEGTVSSGADLTRATGLSSQQLAQAITDDYRFFLMAVENVGFRRVVQRFRQNSLLARERIVELGGGSYSIPSCFHPLALTPHFLRQ
jgi:hypothetical protein